MRILKIFLPLLAIFILAQLALLNPQQTHGSEQSISAVTVSGIISGPGGPVANVLVSLHSNQDDKDTATNSAGFYSMTIETDGELLFHVRPQLSTKLTQINQWIDGATGNLTLNGEVVKGHLLNIQPTGAGNAIISDHLWLEVQPLAKIPPPNQWFELERSGSNQSYQAVLPPDIYYVSAYAPPPGYFPTTKSFDLRSGDLTSTLPLNEHFVHPIPYDPPDASRIVIGAVDDLGEAAVTGSAGAALPLANVLLVNLTSTHQAHAISEADGSFATRIYAPPGSAVMVKHGPASERWHDLDVGLAEGVNPFPGTIINVPHTHSAAEGELPFAAAGAVESTADDPGNTRNTVKSAWAISGTLGPVIVDGQWTREFDGKYEGKVTPGLYLGGLNWTHPALADLDDDGDLDLVVGHSEGTLLYFRNSGTVNNPIWSPQPGNYGNIHYYHNDGSPSTPNWKLMTTDFLGLDVGGWSRPTFADIDDDDDLDLFIGAEDGTLTFVKNTGSLTVPTWATPVQPYAGLALGAYSAPSFFDVDEDGDLDMLVGLEHGSLAYVRNTGSASSPAWSLVTNQYPGIDVGEHAVPTAADINGDGKDDLLLGSEDGGVTLYLYEGPGASRSLNTAVDPGDLIQIKGKIRLYSQAISAATDVNGISVGGDLNLMMIANGAGEPLAAQNTFMSTKLTPTGFPIQGGRRSQEEMNVPVQVSNLQYRGGHTIEGDLTVTTPLPDDLPAGTYRPVISLGFENVPASGEWLAANVTSQYTFGFNQAILPPLTVGEAKEPHLIWRLLMDDFVQGTRGVTAQEDAGTFELASQIVSQGAPFYVPRLDLRTKEPIVYRLEPFLPMISFTDRRMPAPPLIPFEMPSGQLCVTLQKPDSTTRDLGCEALSQSFNRTKTTRGGFDLNNGTVQLEDVYSLKAASDRFRLAFDQYGKHTVTMTGTVKDLWGNSYSGGGTYDLWIAEPLDIDAGVLPGTPLAVGDAFNPALQFYPQVPAQVTLTVTHFPASDPAQKEVHTVSGQANEYGYFNIANPSIVLTEPGEYRVDVTASYAADDGKQFMGAMSWGGIVMTDPNDAQLIAHGRRGMDSLDYIPNHWFVIGRDLTIQPGAISHILNPYFNGDILWSRDTDNQSVGDSLVMGASIQDTVGTVETAVKTRLDRSSPDISPPGTSDERFSKGEIPLFTSTYSGRPAQMVPGDVDQVAYSYRTSQRPGVRVREVVAEDSESGGYWRLDTLYDDQLGVGTQGDLPNDFKFQYVGAVYRDLQTGQSEYVGQGSGWIFIPDEDPVGNRVMPPFAGPGNGGWTTEGGPILQLKGKDIHIFILPTGVKPGAVLEVGDTFHFAGHIMPALNSQVEVTVTAPGGIEHKISGQANTIGYFYDADDDFVVDRPGLWSVSVKVWHDGLCSGGATMPPYPTGDVLGSDNGRYFFYVTSAGNDRLGVSSPQPGMLPILGSLYPVTVKGSIPRGTNSVSVDYTIGMPGYILKHGQASISDGEYQFLFDPVTLHQDFPNLDLIGRENWSPGLSDTFSIGILLRGKLGDQLLYQANTITIQGEQVFIGGASPNMHNVHLPIILKRD